MAQMPTPGCGGDTLPTLHSPSARLLAVFVVKIYQEARLFRLIFGLLDVAGLGVFFLHRTHF